MDERPFQTEPFDDGALLLTLRRPARLNAFTREMVREFNLELDSISSNRAVRAVVLSGEGRGFCAGQDVSAADSRNRSAPSSVTERLFWQEQFAGMARRLINLPQVVIAAVNGPCAGVGFALALAADIRIAASSARFLVAAVRLGLSAGESGISYLLPRLIGASRAFEIMLTGREISAEESLRIGLCAQVTEDARLLDAARDLTRTILANSPKSVAETKRLMWRNLDAPSLESAIELENRAQILASLTDDYKEATAAFTEKRAPRFSGN